MAKTPAKTPAKTRTLEDLDTAPRMGTPSGASLFFQLGLNGVTIQVTPLAPTMDLRVAEKVLALAIKKAAQDAHPFRWEDLKATGARLVAHVPGQDQDRWVEVARYGFQAMVDVKLDTLGETLVHHGQAHERLGLVKLAAQATTPVDLMLWLV